MNPRRKRLLKLQQTILQPVDVVTPSGNISCFLRRSSRRRTMEIAVTETLQVRVTVPNHTSFTLVEEFIHRRADWILRTLREKGRVNAAVRQRRYDSGHEFLFMGRKHPLTVVESAANRGSVFFDGAGWRIEVPSARGPDREAGVKDLLLRWYREQAGEVLGSRVFHYSRVMGLEPLSIALRNHKRIWGSCHHRTRAIHLNWQIIMAPLESSDYVVVHELAHLKEPNHSRRFWAVVAGVLPDFKMRQEWFKQHQADMSLP